MCQCQMSSVELASGAAMPPCAATVCERVGKTLVKTATFRFARASSNAARMPEPPAPTTSASNLRMGMLIATGSGRSSHVHREQQERADLHREPQPVGLDVIHKDVA